MLKVSVFYTLKYLSSFRESRGAKKEEEKKRGKKKKKRSKWLPSKFYCVHFQLLVVFSPEDVGAHSPFNFCFSKQHQKEKKPRVHRIKLKVKKREKITVVPFLLYLFKKKKDYTSTPTRIHHTPYTRLLHLKRGDPDCQFFFLIYLPCSSPPPVFFL